MKKNITSVLFLALALPAVSFANDPADVIHKTIVASVPSDAVDIQSWVGHWDGDHCTPKEKRISFGQPEQGSTYSMNSQAYGQYMQKLTDGTYNCGVDIMVNSDGKAVSNGGAFHLHCAALTKICDALPSVQTIR